MILFGHLGITLAVASAIDKKIIRRSQRFRIFDVDYRQVLIFSLLPDILDKSVLFFMAGEKFRSGRLFAHSFLFSLALFITGLIAWYWYKKSWALTAAFCSFMHQILDNVWDDMYVFITPVYNALPLEIKKNLHGLYSVTMKMSADTFANGRHDTWSSIGKALFKPYFLIPEIVGILILTYLAVALLYRKRLISFFWTGKMAARKQT